MIMDIRLVPALKGLITGLLMTGVTLGVYYSNLSPDSPIQYAIYLIYGLGIIWTLLAFRRSSSCTGKFGDLFGQGFRCFIVVTLVMVVFTFAFNRMHPEFAEESAQAYKELQIKQKNKFPADIENELASYKKSYNTIIIYGAIFGYLIIGAGLTAAASALLMRRK
jgi:hypothetical protein